MLGFRHLEKINKVTPTNKLNTYHFVFELYWIQIILLSTVERKPTANVVKSTAGYRICLVTAGEKNLEYTTILKFHLAFTQ